MSSNFYRLHLEVRESGFRVFLWAFLLCLLHFRDSSSVKLLYGVLACTSFCHGIGLTGGNAEEYEGGTTYCQYQA